MENLNLPKPYLSYSAISTFLHNKNQFRRQYYLHQSYPTTPELIFGKSIADKFEQRHPDVAHVPQLPVMEQSIKCDIEGVPIFGFIDSFDPETKTFYEYKTGRHPWTKKRVNKHLQLDIYSLCIETIWGEVNDVCTLIWLETKKTDERVTGLVQHHETHGIALTGKVKAFERKIGKRKRAMTKDLIVQVAKDISDDYTAWQESQRVVGLV